MERLLRRQRFLSHFSRSLFLEYSIILSSHPVLLLSFFFCQSLPSSQTLYPTMPLLSRGHLPSWRSLMSPRTACLCHGVLDLRMLPSYLLMSLRPLGTCVLSELDSGTLYLVPFMLMAQMWSVNWAPGLPSVSASGDGFSGLFMRKGLGLCHA